MPTSNGYTQSQTGALLSSFSDLEDLTGFIIKKSQYSASSGGYADIWVANSTRAVNGRPAGQKLAVKVIRSFTDNQCDYMKKLDKAHTQQRLWREVIIWKELEHKNILPLLGVVRGFGPYVSMVCPWMAKGSLTQYLGRQGSELSHQRRLQIIREVASGLTYLHLKDVIHGDLSGSNILLDDAERVCISDFGLATIVAQFRGTSLDSSTVSGAIRWMAPECVFGPGPTTPSSDVYSFGSIMYQVMIGRAASVSDSEGAYFQQMLESKSLQATIHEVNESKLTSTAKIPSVGRAREHVPFFSDGSSYAKQQLPDQYYEHSSLRTMSAIPPRQSTFDYATCVRCGHTFKRYLEDTDDGDIILIHRSEVDYSTSAWSCCARGLSSPGCCTSPQHCSSD
ncbi:hypothetical protein PLEOSDRAFT_166837 [Pleurotus ostreatus PC15]|uniref:Protein kinase domain-containing protein n=1 Tax=Pleurotus ostreatus (strain PC15) TaxID=1137138 RepID=A0A067NL39_PLEO1|nr:hypothetical protein PLEOSDRAFT_166837 [Pleurotus ostreatus PC15]